jgi:hypothetical protein
MEILLVLLVPLITAGGFASWFWYGDDARRTRRVLRKTRVTPVANLVDGQLACVVGTVELEVPELLTSMVTRRRCVAYDTNVYFFAGNASTVPARVEVERRLIPFFVRDATGVVRIDAAEAALCNRPSAKSERYEERVIDHTNDHAKERHYRESTGTKATLTGTKKFPLLIDHER